VIFRSLQVVYEGQCKTTDRTII